jgi:hypothetical protein
MAIPGHLRRPDVNAIEAAEQGGEPLRILRRDAEDHSRLAPWLLE